MWGRTCPCSSMTRNRMPGKRRSRSSVNSPSVAPDALTAAASAVYERRGLGIRTRIVAAKFGTTEHLLGNFDRVDLRQVRGETLPGPPFVAAAPDLTTGRPEIDADRIARISTHRLALDRQPRLRRGQAARLALPRLAAIHRAIDRGLAARGHTRPDFRAVHRKHPQRVGISRVENHRESDRAHALGHGRAYVLPALGGPVESVDAAVVLLIESVGQRRMKPHAMRIMTVLRVRVGKEVRAYAMIERPPIGPAIDRFEDAAAGHADVHMPWVARVDQHRVHLRAIRRSILIATTPRLARRVLVEAFDAAPRCAGVLGTEQSLRRCPRIPHAGFRGVARRQPERMIDDASAALAKCRWLLGLVP